jgi:hypothetical protein
MLGARYLGLALLGWTLCAPSQAATMTYDFSAGPTPTLWKQSESFPPTGLAQPPVRAWGFWDDGTGVFVQGYIRQWTLGLGACGANELGTPANPGNCPGSGTHRAIDDITSAPALREEWVLLTFADPVAFDSVVLQTINGEPPAGVVYWYGDDDDEFQNGLIGKSFIDIAAKAPFSGGTTVNGTLDFDLGGGIGTFLLIGPDGTDGPTATHPDAFYLDSLTVEQVAQVPAPASGILFASVLAIMAGLRIRRPT